MADTVPPSQSFNIGELPLPPDASTESTQQEVLSVLSGFVPGGIGTVKILDGSGNSLTSQVNGSQRALDVGIDVAGVQVDPRDRNWALAGPGDSIAISNLPDYFISNKRIAIIGAPDATAALSWADFGTATQRITSIAYTSATIYPANTATKTFSYTSTGGRYRLDSIVWSIS